ncbi:MAG: class I SAM-dependent methyltransferase [Actinomycetota bacterium]
MNVRSVMRHLKSPSLLVHRARCAIYELRHPGEPWMAPGAIRFCDDHLRDDWRALEWGSGRSTGWFARRVGSLTSIEHDPAWYARVCERLRAEGIGNVDYKLIPLDPDKESGGIYFAREHLPAYVLVATAFDDASLDLVVVDGAYRISCALAALPKLRPGGLLLVDDASWFPTLREGHIPPDWPLVYESDSPVSSTTIWRKP